MLVHRLYPLFAAALLLAPLPALAATPAALQAAQSPTMPGPSGDTMRHAKGGKLGGFLSPEQRAMFVAEAREQVKDMTPDQRKGFRKDQVKKFLSLSDSDRQKFKSDLQAKWDALPQGQKDRVQQRLARQGAQ